MNYNLLRNLVVSNHDATDTKTQNDAIYTIHSKNLVTTHKGTVSHGNPMGTPNWRVLAGNFRV